MPKIPRRYNFEALEYKLQKSYDIFLQDITNSLAFEELFIDIRTTAFAILQVDKVSINFEVDYMEVAHEYSTYLCERVIIGTFIARVNPGEKKFGWVPYIRVNIRHILFSKFKQTDTKKYISLDELKDIMNEYANSGDDFSQDDQLRFYPQLIDWDSLYTSEIETSVRHLAFRCARFLKLLYGKDRYYCLISKLMALKVQDYSEIVDGELKDFTQTSLVLFKRLYESYNLNDVSIDKVDKVFNSSLYLASILSADVDKRLYISLDLSNLYRLALAYGGETLKVPSISEIEELVSTAKVSYDILSANLRDVTNIKKLRDKIKDDYDVFIRFDKLETNVRSLLTYLQTEMVDPTGEDNPMLESLMGLSSRSSKIVDSILNKMEQTIDDTESSTELVKVYKDMVANLNLSLNMMTNVKSLMESKVKGC